MNERIKQLRKSALHLTQAKFGEKIGVGQQSVANMENGGTVTERNFDAICRAFNVNPEWLRDGVGEMFLPDNVDTYLDKVAAKNNLTTEDKALIKSMLELPPETRKAFIDWAEKLVDEIYSPANRKADERRALEKQIADAQMRLAELDGQTPPYRMTPAQKRELINHQLDLEEEAAKRATASSVSTTNISKPADLKAKSQ